MRSVDSNDLVATLGVNKDDGRGIFWLGKSIDFVDLKCENVSSAGIPRDRPALAYVPEEMMLRAGGDLLDLQFRITKTAGRGRSRVGWKGGIERR